MYYHPIQQKINNREPIIFIHGTGMDHTVWTLPVRYFSRKKIDVLAIDLPGHGQNKDKPLDSISKISTYIYNFLDNFSEISNIAIIVVFRDPLSAAMRN